MSSPLHPADPPGAQAAGGEDLAVNAPGALSTELARDLRAHSPLRSRAERLLKVRTAESWLRATATSERKVAADLNRLGPGWEVLHAVPVGEDRPAVSHLLIGPPGVFTLATRGFPSTRAAVLPDRVEAQVLDDEIRVHGEGFPFIGEARAQAWRAARSLSAAVDEHVLVRPVVVLVGIDEVRFSGIPERVDVLPRRQLIRWLRRFPARLGEPEVRRYFAAARRGDTWVAAGT